MFSSLRKNAAASDALQGRSKNAPGELRIRVSNRYFTFIFLLCIENALPAAIFFTSSNSWRAFWASALAFLAVSMAEASSDACVFASSSKPSCFFHESFQLLLHLAGLDPKPFSLDALLGRFLLGL